jgi:hypothetical protein
VFLTIDDLFRQWLSTNILTPSKSLFSSISDLLQVEITWHWLPVWKSKHSVIGCRVIATTSHHSFFFFNVKNWLVLERKLILKLWCHVWELLFSCLHPNFSMAQIQAVHAQWKSICDTNLSHWSNTYVFVECHILMLMFVWDVQGSYNCYSPVSAFTADNLFFFNILLSLFLFMASQHNLVVGP